MTVLVAALSAFVGLISGYFLRDLIETARRRSREDTMKRPKSQNLRLAGLLFVVVLLLAEGLALVKIAHDYGSYTGCMAQWQQDKSAADNARAAAATEVSSAMDAVVKAVYTQNPDDFKKAISDYIAIRKDQDEARAKNPPPAPPDEVCGKPGGTQ